MKAEEEDKTQGDANNCALLERRRRLFPCEPYPVPSSAMHQWGERKYAELKKAWAENDSVIWCGEAFTGDFTARLTCQAWIYEMLVCDLDSGIQNVSVFTETLREANLIVQGLLDMLRGDNVPILMANRESVRLVNGRSVGFLPVTYHGARTHGICGERIVMMVHDDQKQPTADKRRGYDPDISRVLHDVVGPALSLKLSKVVVYGIPCQ